jgi:hypothetical protein
MKTCHKYTERQIVTGNAQENVYVLENLLF